MDRERDRDFGSSYKRLGKKKFTILALKTGLSLLLGEIEEDRNGREEGKKKKAIFL